ncbi:tripartite motif-containing protein 16-like [Erpetoichthys calabaricus]|nr:tripartite motif-containing protein 16-like [Erpetoichthys calabaricus]
MDDSKIRSSVLDVTMLHAGALSFLPHVTLLLSQTKKQESFTFISPKAVFISESLCKSLLFERVMESKLQDEFICSVCLELLKDPVSIPCGHNFCMQCISECWDQMGICSCPHCRETFNPRPALRKNTLLAEVVGKIKKCSVDYKISQGVLGLDDVECNFCIGKNIRAVKSCLTCLASFCELHVQPHYEFATWKNHRLTDPSRHLQEKVCQQHQKALELFCRTDETCICCLCAVTGHRGHETVEPETQRARKQTQLRGMLIRIQKEIQERQKNLNKIKHKAAAIKLSADKVVQKSERTFTDMIECIKATRKRVTEQIREHEKNELSKVDGAMAELEKEIEELKKSEADLTELSRTDDHIYFLQTFSSFCVPPGAGDPVSVTATATADFFYEELRKKVSHLKECVEKVSIWATESLSQTVTKAPIYTKPSLALQDREDFLQYFCHLTLDPNTANRDLFLSNDNRKVTGMRNPQIPPDHPDRFDRLTQVLCKEALSGARFYWEVEWKGREAEIGVAYKGIGRKGRGAECLLGYNDNSWSLCCSDSYYCVQHNKIVTRITAPYCCIIGVYLDWPSGSLSFYSVSEKMTLLHRFHTTFSEPLYPGFRLNYADCSVTIYTHTSSPQ